MRKLRPVLYAILFALVLSPAASAQAKKARTGAGKALHKLFADEWEYQLRISPLTASYLGDRRYNDRWDDVSLESLRAQQAHNKQVLAQLHAIDRSRLSAEDKVNYDLFEYQYKMQIEAAPLEWYLVRTNTFDGIQTVENVVDSLPFDTVKDYQDWIVRLKAFPTYLDQNMELMRLGAEKKHVISKIIADKVIAQFEQMDFNDPSKHGFYVPFTRIPQSVPASERERLQQEGQQAIKAHVLPAFAKFLKFMKEVYRPASLDTTGIVSVPNSDKIYGYLARYYTTTDLTPKQIHEIGLSEVKRIRGEMEKIKNEVNFKGSLSEFFNFLRTDPQFFYKTEEELLTATRALAKSIDPKLVKVMKTMPRLPYGVEPVPAAVAPGMTMGYASGGAADGSRACHYYINTYKPETRPKWELTALTLHEAIPGHCFQGSLAQELTLPSFRRFGGYTAYVEGWGLYSESLGYEMEVYKDPYSRFGQLSYEIWRSTRLVVDTGMHAMGWTKQQAVDYFVDNVATSRLNAENEIDRYISWPGQALGYKIGQLKIRELRTKAEKALGDQFKPGEFHDVVLLMGAVPLKVLEARVDEWIASKQKPAKK